ncbi:zinc finger protein 658-like [Zerene cesonia]|uniref:zinc finger protein 658-like n=1 Tax=Zerene cesonia TaxID=33412 RepID=UPI0018E58653|nr:zinc finger protein 658-like [Zerene cesonia]
MRCYVPSCYNDSRNKLSKSQGITFHVFPTEPKLRAAWMKALHIENGSPKDRKLVCSEHFKIEDIYVTANGLRRLRSGAVPINTYDHEIIEDIKLMVCRVCLGMDLQLLPIARYSLDEAYDSIMGCDFLVNNLPQYICKECAFRLKNCWSFKNKCLRARNILDDLFRNNHNVTLECVKTIDRQANQLASNLSTKTLDPDSVICLEYSESENALKAEVSSNGELNIFENQEDFNEPIDVNDANNELVNDENAIINDAYSSDDSLPLELQRRKRKKDKAKSVKKVRKREEPKIDRRRKPFLNNDLSETLFTITDLTVEEQVAEIQKRQESANYKNAVYKCTACFKGFLDEDAYNCHVLRHTNQCGDHQCSICKTYFKHPHALRKHITAHHTQRYSCNRCPYVTTHRQTARLHERWHKGTKYKCPHCQDEFVKFTTYMGHIRIKHPSDFVCALCGYSFVSEKGIELHKKLKHRLEDGKIPDDGPLCELCNVRFLDQAAHKRHLSMSARHRDDNTKEDRRRKGRRTRDANDKKDDGSDADEKKKSYPSQLRKAEGPIPCEQCGLQLEDSRAYHSHFRRMHPDKNRTNYPSMKSPCMCEVCGRMFQSQALLKDHRWVHTGERPFACALCGKAFRMRQRLVAHARVHSAPRAAYACALCGKSFSTHSNCQRHMFIHTGLRPYKCEMCGKSFKHASEKRAHITYVHLKKPWPKRSRGKRREKGPPQNPASMPNEMDAGQAIWAPCDPKLAEMNSIIDKPMYYNLKM